MVHLCVWVWDFKAGTSRIEETSIFASPLFWRELSAVFESALVVARQASHFTSNAHIYAPPRTEHNPGHLPVPAVPESLLAAAVDRYKD